MNNQNSGFMGFVEKLTLPNFNYRDTALLILRVLSLALIFHGVHKAMGFSAFVEKAMVPNPIGGLAPTFFTVLVVAGQILLPLALLIGLFSRISGGLLALLFTFIIFAVNIPSQGLIGKQGGLSFESSLFYFIIGLTIFLSGPGKYSVDHFLNKSE
ncbi:putative oxidoreductase [Arcanobacterium wilhelmae]|uniref:Oxidoreductase n=1 Tax=Arcanobacterium wilhelmae TaxID=1803177 RepID=A0ABT9NAM3_9ACTO|nr:DoxX family protein [Arcanobacterium wilhelmae]MDP9800740.1 putative oxidoreductase [Arcanobacterium wilhelmae]WFN90138.1 DoxX family protein [Arcanobacterium wilhelmae]